MEIDDDYESFSFPNNEPSPSPKHRRLKRLKKVTVVADQSAPVESASELIDLPRVDFASIEALESSDIRAFDDSSEPLSSPPAEGFGDVDGKEPSTACADTLVNGDRKGTKRLLKFEEGFDDGSVKEKDLSSCYDDTGVNSDRKETRTDLEFEESLGDDGMENNSNSGVGDSPVRTNRKETKRTLEFEDEITESAVDKIVGNEAEMNSVVGETPVRRKETKRTLDFDDEITESVVDSMVGKEALIVDMKIKENEEKEVNEDAMNEKKGKKKRLKSSSEDPKVKASSTNKKREAKERRAHLEQLHAESQRLLRETRGASFKPVPIVQKPISSILEKIRQRKLEVSKKFSQLNCDDPVNEDDACQKQAINHSKNVEIEVGDLSESVKEDKVSSDPKEDDIGMDGPDVCGEQKTHGSDSSQMPLDDKSTPVLRAPVDDTQDLFGDSQTSDSRESKDEEPDEHTISSQEEEMEPSLLTMKLKFDSVPDDISDEEENDKENVAPYVKEGSSPKGAPVKAFLDDEAEEEDDSDNDRMRFGDDEENEDDDDDIEELREMIVTGYKEKPVDKETRDELHQKWLEEKDAAGTDDLLRRLNVASKFREGSLLDDDDDDEEEEEGEEDVEVNDDVEEDEERPRVPRLNSKKAKEMIAQIFLDKDEGFSSSDDEETEKMLAKERLINKAEEKGKLVSPDEDDDSREVFCRIKKLNTVPDAHKKAKTTAFIDTIVGNSNSSSKSSFLSRVSSHSFPTSSKQGSSVTRSYIFGRDDSNSRSSMSISEDAPDTTTKEIQTKKATTKYSISQSQVRSSTTKLDNENSSTSFFEMLKRSSVQTNVGNKASSVVELSQSVFAAFKIPKKPVKIQGRV